MNGEVTLLDEYVYNEQKMFEKEPMWTEPQKLDSL